MSEFKYIMFKIPGPIERLVPVIFPDLLVHELVGNALKTMKGDQMLAEAEVVSAGSINLGPVETFGKSTTLKVDAKESDAQIIMQYPYWHGMMFDD